MDRRSEPDIPEIRGNGAPGLKKPTDEGARGEVTLQIGGMTCSSCAGRIEKALGKLPVYRPR